MSFKLRDSTQRIKSETFHLVNNIFQQGFVILVYKLVLHFSALMNIQLVCLYVDIIVKFLYTP